MAISFQGAHFPQDILLMGMRWYVASPLSSRHGEALLKARGVEFDHATITRWVITESPLLAEAFHRRKRPMGVSWRLDETSMKVKGEGRAPSRAVDNHGQISDFLLTEQRDEPAATRFLTTAIRRHGVPETSTSAGSAANTAAIESDTAAHGPAIAIRTITSLNNIVEQDHRGVQHVSRLCSAARRLRPPRRRWLGSNVCP